MKEDPELEIFLKKAVNNALLSRKLETIYLGHVVESNAGLLGYYRGSLFEIKPISEKQIFITLGINAFDMVDARTQAQSILISLLDMLSVETNNSYWTEYNRVEADYSKESYDENYVDDPDWMDGYPYKNGTLVISQKGKELIDYYIKYAETEKDLDLYLRSCRLFHSALKYLQFQEKQFNILLGTASSEVINLLFIQLWKLFH